MSQVASNITIKDCVATPSNIFYALRSTNGGNNTGWNFKTVTDTTRTPNEVVSYATIKDCNAINSNIFYALNSTNSGNNTGWTFQAYSALPTVGVACLTIKDCNGTGAVWYSQVNDGNIDAGNNTGWYFNSLIGKDLILFFMNNRPIQ